MSFESLLNRTVKRRRSAIKNTASGAPEADWVWLGDLKCRLCVLSDTERAAQGIQANVKALRLYCLPDADIKPGDEVWEGELNSGGPYQVQAVIPRYGASVVHHLECDLWQVT